MKVVRLIISNFRGVRCAELYFDSHALLVGPNNVGKSTICDALDLVLGPDRLNRFPPVEEFDFHNSHYLAAPAAGGEPPSPIPLRVEVVLVDLSQEVENRCGGHTEFWHVAEKRLLGQGEVAAANPPEVVSCLRLETQGVYSVEEDEFEAQTFFSHSRSRPRRADTRQQADQAVVWLQPLDIAGVVFFDAESDGSMPKFGTFFKSLGLTTVSFYDQKNRTAEEKRSLLTVSPLIVSTPTRGSSNSSWLKCPSIVCGVFFRA